MASRKTSITSFEPAAISQVAMPTYTLLVER